MKSRKLTYQEVLRLERQKRLGIWLSENCNKARNSLNGVSFGELMHQLGATPL